MLMTVSSETTRAALASDGLSRSQVTARDAGDINLSSLTHSIVAAPRSRHTAIRRSLNPAFSQRATEARLRAYQSDIEQLTDGLDRSGEADLVADFVDPASRLFTARVLGASEETASAIRLSARVVSDLWTPAAAKAQALEDLCRVAYDDAATAPGRTNSLTPLESLRAAEQSTLISREEARQSSAVLAALATDAIQAPLYAAAWHIVRSRLLRETITMSSAWAATAREATRFANNALFELPRRAVRDLDLAGIRVEKHQLVVTSVQAAGWDPVAAACPSMFDVARPHKRSLSFGQGRRACPARLLATTGIAIALRALVTSFPSIAPVDSEPASAAWWDAPPHCFKVRLG